MPLSVNQPLQLLLYIILSEIPSVSSDTCGHSFQLEASKPKSSVVLPEKELEKFVASRKVSGITKREYILRQKSLQLQKDNRTSGSRGTSRKLRSFGGLVLDEKIKSLADSASMKMKNASIKVNKILVAIPLDNVQNSTPMPISYNTEASTSASNIISNEKCSAQWVPQVKKDEMILKLVPRVMELQSQLQEWANQKASGQIERVNAVVHRLEVENAAIRREMEAAKLRATESSSSCQEVLKREKKTLMKFQSWERQKDSGKGTGDIYVTEFPAGVRTWCGVDLYTYKQQIKCEDQKASNTKIKFCFFTPSYCFVAGYRWKQEKKAKEDFLALDSSLRKEREHIEAPAKSKEDTTKLKTDFINVSLPKDTRMQYIPTLVADFEDHSKSGGLKRERECVMCLSEVRFPIPISCAVSRREKRKFHVNLAS
ncbi:hypothetical protein RND71_009979 [Anisodus tanguticus]|uniref:Uncharacterized protein n=1 Tax=Anisodus tanguticus TaxID=243964 RepID=A0AAE1SJ18_9SOLA|nr:hypothetical protein RND71_009979 [Anisodus tanguticus]